MFTGFADFTELTGLANFTELTELIGILRLNIGPGDHDFSQAGGSIDAQPGDGNNPASRPKPQSGQTETTLHRSPVDTDVLYSAERNRLRGARQHAVSIRQIVLTHQVPHVPNGHSLEQRRQHNQRQRHYAGHYNRCGPTPLRLHENRDDDRYRSDNNRRECGTGHLGSKKVRVKRLEDVLIHLRQVADVNRWV